MSIKSEEKFICPPHIKKMCGYCGGIQDEEHCISSCSFYLGQITPDNTTEEEQESQMFTMKSELMHNIDQCINRKYDGYIDDIDRGTQIRYKCGKGFNRCYACKEFVECE